MRALKIAGIVGGAGAVLVVVGIAVIASRFDAERIKSELARAVQEKKQRTLKIDGALELSFWPNVGVRLGKLSLSEHASAQEFASVDTARVSVAVLPLLSKRVVVDTVEVSGARANIIRHADGTLNIDDLIAKDKSEIQPVQIDVAGIKIADVQLTWRDEKAGSTTVISRLGLTTGRVQADTGKKTLQVDALSLAVKGQAGAERSVDAKLTLSGIDGTGQALRIAKLTLDLDARSGAASVKGALTSALTADLEHRTLALEKFSGEFDVAHPQMPTKHLKLPFSGTLRADLAKQSVAGHIAAQLDESKVALNFEVAKFAPLALGFDLDIDKLDVDKYLPPQKAGAAEKKGGDGKLYFSDLKNLNLNGTVKIGSLQVANVKATNVKLQLKAASGRLGIAPHAASLYEDTLSPRT